MKNIIEYVEGQQLSITSYEALTNIERLTTGEEVRNEILELQVYLLRLDCLFENSE